MVRICVLLFIAMPGPAAAQESFSDSGFYKAAIAHAKNTHVADSHHSIPVIYSGTEHLDYPASVKGLAYFDVSEWVTSSVVCEGLLYADVPLKYDLVKDVVVVRHPSGTAISLFSPRINSFTVNGHRFVYVKSQGRNVAAGFYEMLAAGKITVLTKRTKTIAQKAQAELEQFFEEKTSYYLVKDGVYHPVSSEGSVLDLLPDRKKDIQDYLKKNKIKFNRNRELAMVKIAAYYNN